MYGGRSRIRKTAALRESAGAVFRLSCPACLVTSKVIRLKRSSRAQPAQSGATDHDLAPPRPALRTCSMACACQPVAFSVYAGGQKAQALWMRLAVSVMPRFMSRSIPERRAGLCARVVKVYLQQELAGNKGVTVSAMAAPASAKPGRCYHNGIAGILPTGGVHGRYDEDANT